MPKKKNTGGGQEAKRAVDLENRKMYYAEKGKFSQ
jgi:hypothetical protein